MVFLITSQADAAPSPLSVMAVGDSVRFVWRSVVEARAYQVEMLSDSGTVLATQSTTDTTLVMKHDRLKGAARGWVRALRRDGSSRSSAAITLPATRGAPR